MPQLQNLVLTDRAATPVNHTFTPLEVTKDGIAIVEESTGVPIGNNRVSLLLNKTTGGRYKITLKYAFPIVQNQVINGISNPIVVRTSYADITFSFEQTSSEQERKDVIGMVYSSLAVGKTLVEDTLVKLQAPR